MSMRLQVVMSEDDYDEIRETARQHRTTVSEWVRRALRQYRPGPPGSITGGVVREARSAYGEGAGDTAPVPSKVSMEIDVDPVLLEQVMDRYHISTPRLAVDYALRNASAHPMTRSEVLGMEGFGWEGDLDRSRAADEPDVL